MLDCIKLKKYNFQLTCMIVKIFLFAIILSLSTPLRAEIYSASSVEEINNSIMEMLDKRESNKSLIIMPLENFILEPKDDAFYLNDNESQNIAYNALKKAKFSRRIYRNEMILTEYEQRFSDQMIPEFIRSIQEKNVPLIVVTKNTSGSLNKIAYLEVWTWQYLLDRGIDLSKSTIGGKQIIFNKQYKKVYGTYPTFYKGLLSCNAFEQYNSPQNIIATLLAI